MKIMIKFNMSSLQLTFYEEFSRNYDTYIVSIVMVSILTFVAMLMNQINPTNYMYL